MKANRVDNNQQEIIDALRAAGATVQPLNAVKCGCPDLLVGYRGTNYLIEVKSKGGRLTDDEFNWMSSWDGFFTVTWTVEDALRIIGIES
jgi:hypothetical protein